MPESTINKSTLGITTSSSIFRVLTVDDNTDLEDTIKAIYVTGPGDLVIQDWTTSNPSVTIAVTAGQQIPIRPRRILSGTTAQVLGLFL